MLDFTIEPEFQAKLDWAAGFVRKEVEPLDLLFPHGGDPYDTGNEKARAILRPLQQQVRAQGLWACHLGPELGGPGYGQVKLAYLNEILGRSYWAPTVFGTAAPDTGNAEILAMFGTEEQKARYLQPLLDGEIVSTFSMTEPQAGADPKEFVSRLARRGRMGDRRREVVLLQCQVRVIPHRHGRHRSGRAAARPYVDADRARRDARHRDQAQCRHHG